MSWISDLIAAGLKALKSKPKKMFGIDVSNNNGRINWDLVAGNDPKVDFVIIKVSEGATSSDKQFLMNVNGCQKNKLNWTGYHFATWNNKDIVGDAKAEAKFFLSHFTDACRPTLPFVVLDVETNKPLPYSTGEVLTYITTFCKSIEAAGFEPCIYSSTGFLQSYLPPNHNLGKYKLWLANYNKVPKVPKGWDRYTILQYTDQGKISGVATICDLNKTDQPIY